MSRVEILTHLGAWHHVLGRTPQANPVGIIPEDLKRLMLPRLGFECAGMIRIVADGQR